MSPFQSVEHELVRNATSLRALARDLVGSDAADDLVQETALRALRSPPPRPTGLGAWLATVLRRLAATHRRDSRRRASRENAAAAAEALPPVDEAIARRDSLRSVTAALFALPEPYQSALLLRYFEGLSPTAIAARTQTPLATVKSRLQRGLALLRDGLDCRGGDGWRGALLLATGLRATPLLPLPTAAGTLTAGKVGSGALTAGAVAMANMLKISIAAALVVGAVAVWQLGGGLAAPPQPQATATVSTPAAVAASSAQLGGKTEAPRTVVEVAAFPGADLAHPFEFALRCKVIDDHGLPVSGAAIALWPLGGADNRWAETTDATGTVTLRWHGRTATAHMALRVADGITRAIDIAAGSETPQVLLGESSEHPVKYAGFLNSLNTDAKASLELTAHKVATVETRGYRASRSFDRTGELQPQRGMHPELVFADLAAGGSNGIAILEGLPVLGKMFEAKVAARSALRMELATAVFTEARDAENAPADPADDHGTIAGTVFGEDGKPAANTLVCWSTQPDQPLGRTQTGDDGTFQLKDVPIGPVEVRAGGGRAGLARQTALVVARSDTPVALTLARGQTIRGTAVGKDHAALDGWVVEYEALDGTWVDRATVRKDGLFLLPNLPGRPGRLVLHKNKRSLAAAVLPSVLPDSGPVAFDLGATVAAGSLHLRIPAAAVRNEPPADEIEAAHLAAQAIKVLVWQQDTQLRATLDGADDGSFACAGLPAGFYRLEGGNAETGWCDLGTQYVDGKGLLDLGTIALPEPGVLRVANRPANVTIELYHRRQHGDVRALRELDAHGEASLPPGKWLLFWRVGDGEPHLREFALRGHATTEIDLGG